MTTIIITVIATYITEFMGSFTNDIIMPIINRDADNDNKPDIIELQEYKYKVNGITFKVGSFCSSLIKVVVAVVVLFILSKYTKK